MNAYNPEIPPNPSEWLALGEERRIDLAVGFHEAAGVDLPDLRMHAVFHCVVETQLAEKYQPALDALDRLQRGGLHLHDSIHAIGSVLAEHLHKIAQPQWQRNVEEHNAHYAAELGRLTAKRWRKRYGSRG